MGGLGAVPTERHPLSLRYPDLPAQVEATVPTLDGFAAMKMSAWVDRHAARDLFDLAGLAHAGAFTQDAADIFRMLTGRPVTLAEFSTVPTITSETWSPQLAHQLAELPSPQECVRTVRSAVAAIVA